MIERLPESWIPPAHLLDLRAQVRLRHTLTHQRGESQQRIQSVLYTTAARSTASCSRSPGASGWPRNRCQPQRASRSRSRWQ